MQSPHDKLFQFAFRHTRHAAVWVRSCCPDAIRTGIDWNELQPAGERIPGGGLRAHFADAIYRAPFVDRRGEAWFVIEHKSYPDAGLHWQLLQYVVHLRRGLERKREEDPPSFVAMVLHHGELAMLNAQTKDVDELEQTLRQHQPQLRLLVDDLAQQEEGAIRRRDLTPLVTLVLLCLKALPHQPPDQVCRAIERWSDLMVLVDQDLDAPVGSDAIDAIGYYALAVTEVAAADLSQLFSNILDRPDNTIMSTLEHTFQRGLAKGKAEGKAEGAAEGRAQTIVRMLELRFGTVSDKVRQTLLTGSPEQLAQWTDRVLTAEQPEDVVAGD